MRRHLAPLGLLAVLAVVLAAQEKQPAVKVERDLVYGKGGDTELRLDLARPEGEGPFPAVVCIHGGGWRGGKRQDVMAMVQQLARRGYVAVTPTYRLVPAARFPAQIEDCKAAVRWLRANAEKYHVDPDRIGAMGFSAGGHLASLLGTSDRGAGLEGEGGHPKQSSRVQAVVNYFGPTDLTRKNWPNQVDERFLAPLLGGTLEEKTEAYRKASPVTHVSKDDPPFLLFHGTEDHLVPLEQSELLAKKLESAGVPARVVVMQGDGHGWGGEKLRRTTEQTLEFFDKHLKK